MIGDEISLRSVAGLVIQATGRTEFEDGLRQGSPGGVLSDNPSVLCCKACVAMGEGWENPICLLGDSSAARSACVQQ